MGYPLVNSPFTDAQAMSVQSKIASSNDDASPESQDSEEDMTQREASELFQRIELAIENVSLKIQLNQAERYADTQAEVASQLWKQLVSNIKSLQTETKLTPKAKYRLKTLLWVLNLWEQIYRESTDFQDTPPGARRSR